MKVIRATKELSVNINGEVYDALLIPREPVVEIDQQDLVDMHQGEFECCIPLPTEEVEYGWYECNGVSEVRDYETGD